MLNTAMIAGVKPGVGLVPIEDNVATMTTC
jgi:hypothetical protein